MVLIVQSPGTGIAAQTIGELLCPAPTIHQTAALKTDDNEGQQDKYLAGQTGVLQEKTVDNGNQDKYLAGQTGVLPEQTPASGDLDKYLAGQTGVMLEQAPASGDQDKYLAGQTGVLPGSVSQEDPPMRRRDYRHGQTGVLLDHQSEL